MRMLKHQARNITSNQYLFSLSISQKRIINSLYFMVFIEVELISQHALFIPHSLSQQTTTQKTPL